MVLKTDPVDLEDKRNSFKKRDLKDCRDDQSDDHEQDNNETIISFKKKKPELELQMTVPAPDIISGISENLDGGNDELVKKADSITFSSPEQAMFLSSRPANELHAAATKLQKFYKSYRTRRNLADCAVVVEELWWKALEFLALRRSSVSFFNSNKSETAVSRWARARTRAAKVGKGLSKDVKGQQLALQHWLEAIDPRHRYGHNLHLYYNVWFESGSSQPFFYWLDVGEGKEINPEKCPRTNLQHQCIKYLGPKEREAYEVILERSGKLIYKQSKVAVNTIEGSKWIFVLSTSRILYVGQKEKGHFHHSSFLAGGATIASGRLVVRHGTLQAVWAYSGHYRPTEENFMELCSFLEEHHVDLTNVKKYPIDDDMVPSKVSTTIHKEQKLAEPAKEKTELNVSSSSSSSSLKQHEINEENGERNRKVEKVTATVKAYEMEKGAVKYKWSTGVGPRIGCVRDYPTQLQFKALEQVNLSPRPRLKAGLGLGLAPLTCSPIPTPRPSPNLHLSPRLAYLGLVSPRVRVPATN